MAGSRIAKKLREWAGMSTQEEGGSRTNVEARGKQVDQELCKAGQEEYCPPKKIPTPTPGDGSRSQREMKMGTNRYSKKRQ